MTGMEVIVIGIVGIVILGITSMITNTISRKKDEDEDENNRN